MIYIANKDKIMKDILNEALDEILFQLGEMNDCLSNASAFYSPYTDKTYINGINNEEMKNDDTNWKISGIGDYHNNIVDYSMTVFNHEHIHKVFDDIDEDDGHDLLDYIDER